MKDIKVYAIVVLYNNTKDLKVITEALLNQTLNIEGIVYVDNSSEMYKELNMKYLRTIQNECNLLYYKTKENIGSAGGNALGMEIAFRKGADFIWLNDQDGLPTETCLQMLIEEYHKINKESIYAPKVLSIEEEKELKNFRSNINFFLNPYTTKKNNNNNIDIVGTTGILIHKNVIKNIGVYNNNIFFVGNEDIEYSLRAKSNDIHIYLVKNSIYHHPDLSIKYNQKFKIISRFSVFRKLLPLYLGTVIKDDKRSIYSTRGAAYINSEYAKMVIKQINLIYSIAKTIVLRIFNSKIDVFKTFEQYKKGSSYKKSTILNYRIEDLNKFVECYYINKL